jgi:hypothetical protein
VSEADYDTVTQELVEILKLLLEKVAAKRLTMSELVEASMLDELEHRLEVKGSYTTVNPFTLAAFVLESPSHLSSIAHSSEV